MERFKPPVPDGSCMAMIDQITPNLDWRKFGVAISWCCPVYSFLGALSSSSDGELIGETINLYGLSTWEIYRPWGVGVFPWEAADLNLFSCPNFHAPDA